MEGEGYKSIVLDLELEGYTVGDDDNNIIFATSNIKWNKDGKEWALFMYVT